MSGFIDWLKALNVRDTKVRATLRRSLSFDPGTFVLAYPYVEPFVKGEGSSWNREVHYLIAGLWAAHWREGRIGMPISIGKACAIYRATSGSSSTETRFMALLNCDTDQLPHHLRQMIALLQEQNIDFDAMMRGLLFWNDEQKRTQNAWARDFYENSGYGMENELMTQEEGKE